MREIKFRAWDINHQIMCTVNQMVFFSDGHISIATGDYALLRNISNFILEQSTGEMDRKRTPEFPKGQEIWEGDDVKASIYDDEEPQILTVYFEKGAFWIDYKESEFDRVPVGSFVGSLEIIGNIHTEEKPCDAT